MPQRRYARIQGRTNRQIIRALQDSLRGIATVHVWSDEYGEVDWSICGHPRCKTMILSYRRRIKRWKLVYPDPEKPQTFVFKVHFRKTLPQMMNQIRQLFREEEE